MGRKKVADMTPEELEKYREYMRQKKRESRQGKPAEKDTRTNSDRKEYMEKYNRAYHKKNKEKINERKRIYYKNKVLTGLDNDV